MCPLLIGQSSFFWQWVYGKKKTHFKEEKVMLDAGYMQTNWFHLGGGRSEKKFGGNLWYGQRMNMKTLLCVLKGEVGLLGAVDLLLLPLDNQGIHRVIMRSHPLPVVHISTSLRGTTVWEMVKDHSPRVLCDWSGLEAI